jgi:hypothetical protein
MDAARKATGKATIGLTGDGFEPRDWLIGHSESSIRSENVDACDEQLQQPRRKDLQIQLPSWTESRDRASGDASDDSKYLTKA